MANKPFVTAYALYMMIGSEYNKCEFKNPIIEGRLRNAYSEVKLAEQYAIEDKVLAQMAKLPISGGAAEISVGYDYSNLVMTFIADHEKIQATIAPDGTFQLHSRVYKIVS